MRRLRCGRGLFWLFACIGVIFSPWLVSAQTITIGETATLTTPDCCNPGLLVVQQVTLSQSAMLQSLTFFVRVVGGQLRLGLYDATGPGGSPGVLRASTIAWTPSVAGWLTQPVQTPVALTAGTYWLAYLSELSTLGYWLTEAGSARWVQTGFVALPANFPSGATSGAYHWSFYATLTLSGAPPAPATNLQVLFSMDIPTLSNPLTLLWDDPEPIVGAFELERGDGVTFLLVQTVPDSAGTGTRTAVDTAPIGVNCYRVRQVASGFISSEYSNTACVNVQ